MKLTRPRFVDTQAPYYPFGGGLDLLTPAIATPPGKVLDSQNYEPSIGGGYRRIDGFERFDGRDLPSEASYWVATVSLTGTVVIGDTITGLTSAATGEVIATETGLLILGDVSGTFMSGESISNGATVGTVSTVIQEAATSPALHADYKHAAANLYRPNVLAVPGSGIVRGVWYYDGDWYAFRDNAGGTAGIMHKATPSGWTTVSLGNEIQFTNAVGEIFAGNTVTGLTSGATALVVRPMLRTGTWTVSGVGTLIISTITGTWQNGEAIQVGGVTKATSSSLATAITRLPGGMLEFDNGNFTGSTATRRMYGCDGVNLGFEFDGTTYVPIRTGMTADTPEHIKVHKSQLFFSFLGSVQHSGIGAPYSWTVVTGASEIATGDYITGFAVQTGSNGAAALVIFTDSRTHVLYGNTSADFNLIPSAEGVGSYARTAQSIGNDTMALSSRGIQRLATTQSYGDFSYASVSHLIQPLMSVKRGLQTCSTSIKTKSLFRVYFNDGTGLAVGLTGSKVNGIMPLDYTIPVRCICTADDEDGNEVTMFGSDDGYVYRLDSGTSFDGEVIEHWLRMPFNHLKSPQVRKRYRYAVFEVSAEGYSGIDITYDLGYGTTDVAQGVASLGQELLSNLGYWDAFTWDSFSWDSQSVNNPRIALDGIEKNISFMLYGSRAQDNPHTIQGVTLCYTPLVNVR